MNNGDKITYFAATDARGRKQPFGIKAKDRDRHMYIIGKTGMGKSTLLENMAIQDLQNGEGIAFIDPHGSTAEKLLDYVPEHRINDVVYFAPFDMGHPIAFNVMEDVGYDKRHLVVSGLMSAFQKIWVDAWSARMEYILSNTLLALLEYPDSTLLDVNRMLVTKTYRNKVVANVTDPIVKAFWEDEFANYTDRYTQEATPAIQNKIGQFTSNPLIRNIVGQPQSSFDIRTMMDEKKILIANLSKGRMGETNADLLGSMLTTKIYLSAMSRADNPVGLEVLPPFYFYVDEFQSIANDSFADILSEARKYKLALTIAHQYVEQMEENVRSAVFGNVGTTITFRIGAFDAEVLEVVFQPKFFAQDLVNLGFAQIYLTLMIDGVGSPPFSAVTLPPIEPPDSSYKDHIIEASRKHFARPRETVEQIIKQQSSDLTEEAKEEHKARSSGGSGGGQSRQTSGSHQSSHSRLAPNKQKSFQERREQEKKPEAPRPQQERRELEKKQEAPKPEGNESMADALRAAIQMRVEEKQDVRHAKKEISLRELRPQQKKKEKPEQKNSALKDALRAAVSKMPEKKEDTPRQETKQGQTKEGVSAEELKKILEVEE